MKDYIQQIMDEKATSETNKNRLREYLQEYFLQVIYKTKLYKNMIFCGGTALRFLYNINRFSEDLDFSLSANAQDYSFQALLKIVKDEFLAAGYNLEIKYKKPVSGTNNYNKTRFKIGKVSNNGESKFKAFFDYKHLRRALEVISNSNYVVYFCYDEQLLNFCISINSRDNTEEYILLPVTDLKLFEKPPEVNPSSTVIGMLSKQFQHKCLKSHRATGGEARNK